MPRLRVPSVLAMVLVSALTLTACGGSALDGITVTGPTKAPKMSVPKGFEVDSTTRRVLTTGTGAKLAGGDTVKVDYLAVNGRTGKPFDSSFTTGTPMTLLLSKDQALPGFIKALKGQRVGARLIAAIPPIDGFASDRAEIGIMKSDTLVFYLVIRAKVPTKASGKAQALPPDVPSIVMKGGRPVRFAKTPTTPATIATASVHVAIQGTGAPVPKGGTVVAQYLGQVYPDGAVFDASWDRGESATFSLTGVIPCWQKLLPGIKVGSRVVLECPTADAYGDTPPSGGKIKAGDSLLFVVDVLDAS